VTVGTQLQLNAVGVSSTGNAAEIPAGTAWAVSDSKVGSISNGVFTAKAAGEVEVQSVLNGKVVGSKKLYVVTPDKLKFAKESLNVIYGVPYELPLEASWNGNPVAINGNDVNIKLSVTNAGTIEGLTFTGNEKSGARNITATVTLKADKNVKATVQIVLYKADETSFDFGDIDGGDRHLAWVRPISNTTTTDNYLYHISDPDEDMVIDYTFALDMEAVEIPEELVPIVFMIPGSDAEGASAWSLLLQLAERVSVYTNVTVTAQFDQDLELNIDNLEVINEYFYLKDKKIDENNKLTMTFGWVDQTAAIDPKTANPLCILHGIKAVPKDGAAWDANDQIRFINSGEVEYDIYLRASTLYTFASDPKNQAKYRLIPFVHEEILIDNQIEKGASFKNIYATFSDSFILDKTNRNGWFDYENFLYYYKDNVPVTGIQKLPGYEDPSKEFFYEFTEDGSCIGTVTGLMEYEGNLYYTIRGEVQKGWKTLGAADNQKTYYFDATGAAVDGKQTIGGYTYIFTDNVLTRGHLETNATGTRYMWAGSWITQAWVTIDGRTAYAAQNGYFFTGLKYTYSPDGAWTYYAFSEDGFVMEDFTGLYDYNGDTYMIKKGIVAKGAWTVQVGNYFYYVNSEGKVVKNRTNFVIGKDSQHDYTNGLITAGKHNIDEQGRITDPFGQEIEIPEEEFDIAFANMTLGNSLAMNFAFEQEPIEDTTGCYAVITKTYADGRENKVVTIPASEWGTARIGGVAHYTLKFDGVAAKEMSDAVYVCIYNANGAALSSVWEDSARSYAMRTLNNPNTSLESQIMVIDLLNYGAAAQKYFDYNVNDLANKLLSPDQMAMATKNVTSQDNRIKGDNYLGTQLRLESQILMRMAFQKVTSDMYAVVSFTDHNGKDKEIIVEGKDFEITGGVAAITIDAIVVADARNLVTVTIYDSYDREVASATDSVESYIARMSTADPLYQQILCFSDGAYNYFH